MKKIKQIINNRSNLIMEYIGQILLDNNLVHANINIDKFVINDKEMCVFDIYVKENNFERHFNTGVEYLYHDLLNKKILKDLIKNYKKYSTIKLGKFDKNKIKISNDIGNQIVINFINDTNDDKEDILYYNNNR